MRVVLVRPAILVCDILVHVCMSRGSVLIYPVIVPLTVLWQIYAILCFFVTCLFGFFSH